jgi:hypothetical protein
VRERYRILSAFEVARLKAPETIDHNREKHFLRDSVHAGFLDRPILEGDSVQSGITPIVHDLVVVACTTTPRFIDDVDGKALVHPIDLMLGKLSHYSLLAIAALLHITTSSSFVSAIDRSRLSGVMSTISIASSFACLLIS